MDLKEQILVALGLNKEEQEVKLGFQAKSEDGTIFVSTAEELEASVDISVLTEDGTTIPVPAGTYKLDTGESFRVEDDGIVAEVLVSETEETEKVVEVVEDEKTELSTEDLDPAVKPISFNPENKEVREKMLYAQNRTETTLDRVFKKLNK